MNTLNIKSAKITAGFYVNQYSVKSNETYVCVKQPVNNIFCCDISGSMYSSLPKMRTQLKNRLSSIVGEDDTITIIAFADESDCYVLKEKVHCNNLKELKELHDAIDRYLRPMGCTDFVSPLVATKNIVKDGECYNFVFLSDGGHNCSAFSNVVSAIKDISGKVSSATIIEYGYWADSERLTEMAELLSGSKIMAEDFDHYTPVIESVFGGTSTKKVVHNLPFDPIIKLAKQMAVYVNPNTKNVHVAKIEDGKVVIPENVNDFYTISNQVVGTETEKFDDVTPLYAITYVLADKLDYDLVEDVLGNIGDTKFIEMYQNSFGKQKLFAFQNSLGKAISCVDERGKIDPNYKANPNKFSVMDFFDVLGNAKTGLIRIASEDFEYTRTTAKTVDKTDVLTEEQQTALKNAKTVEDANKILLEARESAEANKVKMEYVDKGYPVSDFTWNEDRANLSAMLRIDVKLTLPKNSVGLDVVNSFVFRNYTIIKDGIINLKKLPLTLDVATYRQLLATEGLVFTNVTEKGDVVDCTIDYSSLPVVNKAKVGSATKAELVKMSLALETAKFALKYLGTLRVKEKELLDAAYGYTPEQTALLESFGITAKGYSPAKTVVKDGDFYMALILKSAFKGFSSIPKISDVEKKQASGKAFTPSEEFLNYAMRMVNTDYLAGLAGDRYNAAVNDAFDKLTAEKRELSKKIAQMKFALIVSRRWFTDANGFDDNVATITAPNGQNLTMEIKFADQKQNL